MTAVEPYTLEYAQRETGVPAEAIREAAHAYAKADRAMICWTLGITEHHNAVDNVLALISLALLTGHVGRYGSGINPLRGQNNVQGGGDMGALPDRLGGLPARRERRAPRPVRRLWGVRVPPKRGLAPVGDVRGHGARRAHGAVRDRREPAAVRGRPPSHREAAARPRPARRAGHLPDRDRRDRRHRPAGRRGLGRERGDRHQQRAARPAGASGARAAGRGEGRPVDHLRDREAHGRRLGRGRRRGRVERGPRAVAGASRDDVRAARGVGRPPVAVLRRVAPGRAVPALAAVGGPGAGQPGAVRAGRARPAGRPPRRRLPDPPHDRAPPGLVQHGRPVGRLSVSAGVAARRSTWRPRISSASRWPRASGSGSFRGEDPSRCRCGPTRACGPASRS